MMSASGWKNLAEFVGVVAVVGSLIFVGLQVRQERQVAANDSAFQVAENYRQVRNLIIENADVWVRGNAGEELEPAESEIFGELVYVTWAGAFWTATTQARVGPALNVSIHDFAGFLHRNPGARRVWLAEMEVEQSYRGRLLSEPAGTELVNIVMADLEKLGD